MDIKYFESQRKSLFLIIDSDDYSKDCILKPDERRSLDAKKSSNCQLKNKFEQKNDAKCFILRKSNIDAYYHPRAIERLTGISKVDDISLKWLKGQYPHLNIPKKNWKAAFKEMNSSEWREVSNNELEEIIDTIEAMVK